METIKGENEWVWMEVKGHYFYTQFKPNTKLDLEAAKTIIHDAVVLAGDKIYPVLTDIRDMPPHDKEVRDYFANEASASSLVNAILVSSSISRILANFFLTLNKPSIPTRIFNDPVKAAKWLEMFPIRPRQVLV
jgi:hypothetical protein